MKPPSVLERADAAAYGRLRLYVRLFSGPEMQLHMLVVGKYICMVMWLQTIVQHTSNVHSLLRSLQIWCAHSAQ